MKHTIQITAEFDYSNDQGEALALSVSFAILDRVKALAAATGGKCIKATVVPLGEVEKDISPMDKSSNLS